MKHPFEGLHLVRFLEYECHPHRFINVSVIDSLRSREETHDILYSVHAQPTACSFPSVLKMADETHIHDNVISTFKTEFVIDILV